LLLWGNFSNAQIPIPTAPSPQTFCCGTTVSSLQATTNSGGMSGIVWFDVPTGGAPLMTSTPLQFGQKYYAAEMRTGPMYFITSLGGGLGNGRTDVVADRANDLYFTDGNVIKKYDAQSGTISVY